MYQQGPLDACNKPHSLSIFLRQVLGGRLNTSQACKLPSLVIRNGYRFMTISYSCRNRAFLYIRSFTPFLFWNHYRRRKSLPKSEPLIKRPITHYKFFQTERPCLHVLVKAAFPGLVAISNQLILWLVESQQLRPCESASKSGIEIGLIRSDIGNEY